MRLKENGRQDAVDPPTGIDTRVTSQVQVLGGVGGQEGPGLRVTGSA